MAGLVAIDSGPAAARYASIVVDADSGRVLHSLNADTPNFPASLTKIMTLYLTFEALEAGRLTLDQKLPVSRIAAGRSPSKLGLRRGQSISVRDVIGTLVTKSANDAATVVAEALAGSERRFARTMTRKARALGMSKTTFRNASGLPHWRQRSTARDMALLSQALLKDFPQHYHYFSMTGYSYKGRLYRNHNRLLSRYPGIDGLKTGYIRASGFNIAISAVRDGRRLVGVMFGGRSARWRDRQMARLMDRSFRALPSRTKPPKTKLARAATATAPGGRKGGRKAVISRGPLDWSVQVGAFSRYATAHLAVTRAAEAVPDLTHTRFSIRRTSDQDDILFIARLVGFTEVGARRSCGALRLKNIDCAVAPTGEALGQGSR